VNSQLRARAATRSIAILHPRPIECATPCQPAICHQLLYVKGAPIGLSARLMAKGGTPLHLASPVGHAAVVKGGDDRH
jgi:hypothetical protein